MKHLLSLVVIFFIMAGPAIANEIDSNVLIEKSSLTKHDSQIRESSVKVITPSGQGSGTYTLISKKHVVLTASHVVDNLSSVYIIGRQGERVKGDVVYVDVDNDLFNISIDDLKKNIDLVNKLVKILLVKS